MAYESQKKFLKNNCVIKEILTHNLTHRTSGTLSKYKYLQGTYAIVSIDFHIYTSILLLPWGLFVPSFYLKIYSITTCTLVQYMFLYSTSIHAHVHVYI